MGRKKHVNEEYARSKDQLEALRKINHGDFCPFCSRRYMETEHPNPIFAETDHWFATDNRWKYEGAVEHILLIHKDHIESLSEMSSESWLDLKKIFNRVVEERKIPGATLVMRQGDGLYTGATVTHLHAQIISGPGNPDGKPVLARVG